jgi:hypothetical protein
VGGRYPPLRPHRVALGPPLALDELGGVAQRVRPEDVSLADLAGERLDMRPQPVTKHARRLRPSPV